VPISLAAREENNTNATGGVTQALSSEFVRLLPAASRPALVAPIPPGRPFAEVVAELGAAGKDR
jgi:hypothetical protein